MRNPISVMTRSGERRLLHSDVALTLPMGRQDFAKLRQGDLVEVHSSSTQQSLGIVDAVFDESVANSGLRVRTATACLPSRPYYIRFRLGHLPCPHENAQQVKFLRDFETEAFKTVVERESAFQHWLGHRRQGIGSDRLILAQELCAELFPSSNDPLVAGHRLYAAHLFLGRQSTLCRDVFNLQNGAFYFQPPVLGDIGRRALLLFDHDARAVQGLKSKLAAGGIYQLSMTDRLLLDYCLQHALGNSIDNFRHVQQFRQIKYLLEPVRAEFELLNRLQSLPCFSIPISNVLFQAGALQGDDATFDRLPVRIKVAPEADLKPVDFGEPVVTIDDPETVEVDDGLSLQRIGDDWLIGVHIADPTRLIHRDSTLDSVARKRVSTVYLPERTFPMIPWELAKKTSLDPGEPRRALSFFFRLANNGDLADLDIKPTLLHNVQRTCYQAVDDGQLRRGLGADFFDRLHDLTGRHLDFRRSQGYVDLKIPRTNVRVRNGDILMQRDQPTRSQQIVSECMVMAGRVGAQFLVAHSLAGPFRYHLPPDTDHYSTDTLMGTLSLLEHLRPSAIDLRPRDHWAMGLQAYVKVTSPIRRYLDMVTHRQIKAALGHGRPYTPHELSVIIPPVYQHELYIKRIQRAATRFWTNVYLYKASLKGRMELEGMVLRCSRSSDFVGIFLDYPACLEYHQARVWGDFYGPHRNQPFHQVAQVGQRYKFRVLQVNISRGFIALECTS
jgi:hypothetical protein